QQGAQLGARQQAQIGAEVLQGLKRVGHTVSSTLKDTVASRPVRAAGEMWGGKAPPGITSSPLPSLRRPPPLNCPPSTCPAPKAGPGLGLSIRAAKRRLNPEGATVARIDRTLLHDGAVTELEPPRGWPERLARVACWPPG